jgi:hypothetical protein
MFRKESRAARTAGESGRVAVRTIIFVGVAVLILGALVVNAIVTKPPMDVWNENMTMGDKDAAKHFVVYTDMFCPYCDKFSQLIAKNAKEFKKDYLDSKEVYFELRLTDMLKDSHSVNSERGGEAGYCAAAQGRDQFWNYYHAMLDKLDKDYHDKGIGVSKTSPEIPKLGDDYYFTAADTAGIDRGKLESCMKKNETLSELNANTAKIPAGASGLPYFVFSGWTSSGFDGDWSTVKSMFKAGGASGA